LKILDIIKVEKEKKNGDTKLTMNQPDYFEAKTEKIKMKKIKARTCMAICILLSESLKHQEAVKYAEQS